MLNIQKNIRFTKEAYEKLQTDLEKLQVKRKAVLISLRTAREMGDLSENGAYKAARFELSDTDRDIRRLSKLILFGYVFEKNQSDYVDFGNIVSLENESAKMKFMLVDSFESNPQENKLSLKSPFGKAVYKKRTGDKVIIYAPQGQKTYVLTKIE